MKKTIILIALFIFPISVYIIFASAAHNFRYLPVLTKNVAPIEDFESLRGNEVQFKKFITVLCIYGDDIQDMRGNAFNLNDQIYKNYAHLKEFQFVILAETGTRDKAQKLVEDLHDFTGLAMDKWKIVFASPKQIQQLFDSMKTDVELNDKKATSYAFIIDREGNLRGRKEAENRNSETLYGYNTQSIGLLHQIMTDDIDVLFAEYRLKETKKKRDILKYDDK